MNPLWPFLVLCIFAVAGCSAPAGKVESPSSGPTAVVRPEVMKCPRMVGELVFDQCSWPPISDGRYHAVVPFAWTSGRLLLATDAPRNPPPFVDLQLRIIDGAGGVHDQHWKMERLARDTPRFVTFDFPVAPPPFLVVADCSCDHTWLENAEAIADVRPHLDLVDHGLRDILVYYGDPQDPMHIVGEPLHNTTYFTLNQSVIHWALQWQANGWGKAELRTPSGQVIARWNVSGRDTDATEASIGYLYRPLEDGNWSLYFEGYGSFHAFLDETWMKPGAWKALNMTAPRGAFG